MKKLGLIIMATFLSTLLACGQKGEPKNNDIFPAESFSIVESKINNKPVVGSFNMGYKNYDKKNKYKWCLTISMALDLANLFDNGLPKDSESVIANKLEDELLSEINKLATAHYIGHLFNDTFLDIYIYLDDPEKVHQFLQTQINKEGLTRGFKYEITQDAQWANIDGFLK
ncbi:MAG TPA: DUF695 domain-containing protein [Bacteroidia bacterium]|nr:DUF695 domain-containing protein [Bacteroidia bacterium]HQW23279.1 DUF695 domain-containing protein [Bacteroidia bacterium]